MIVETNHDVISHLEQCDDCRRELAARRELNSRLRAAFINAPENQMRPEFADRLGIQLHEQALGKRSVPVVTRQRTLWLALAACLLLAAGLGLVVVRHRMSLQPVVHEVARYDQTPTYSPELNPGMPVNLVKIELAKSAAGDHQDCAVHFALAEKPIDLEVAGRKYDPVYINLTKAVLSQGNTPLDAELVEAHSCVFEGRRFAHIVLRYHGHLVSLLVTETDRTGETNGAPSQTLAQQQVIACSQFDGYQVSCFQTARHAVFVVSDLPEGENLSLARALAPSLYAHVTHTESAA
ncbi:MAG: hypothetical protein ABJC10_13335 [Acidobacteriota bacterium]